MNKSQRVEAFGKLGDAIRSLKSDERKSLTERARNENPWFTEESVLLALDGIDVFLTRHNLNPWLSSYPNEPQNVKTVGVAMAGNIPLVGFHDVVCVLISGHRLKAKLSSQDTVLVKYLLDKLVEIEPGFSEMISVHPILKGVDAMIATGSDNTSRYFEFYFRNVPHIIRKNRTSCAVIQGEEPTSELVLLGRDVFSYFGLGCRNVSKVYIPEEFDLSILISSLDRYQSTVEHHKYANNYSYQKTILLMNGEPFLDSGFFLMKEDKNLVSPISVLYYEKYKDLDDLKAKITQHEKKLQVVTSAKGWFPGSIPFGEAQLPGLGDYADNVDTMKFLGEF